MIDITPWIKLRKELENRIDWLDSFKEPVVTSVVRSLQNKTLNTYEPLLLEYLLEEASSALDRCLTLRNEAYALEISAVRSSVEYDLFCSLSNIDENLEQNTLALNRLDTLRTGFAASSEKHSEKGFAKHDTTLSAAAADDISAAEERASLLQERWKIRRDYEAAYQARHSTPGDPHNYRERMRIVRNLLEDDLREAYEKLKAVEKGISVVYKRTVQDIGVPPLPQLSEQDDILEQLVLWTRQALRVVDIERQNEIEYDIIVPLIVPWRHDNSAIMSDSDLEEALGRDGNSKQIRFELSNIFFNQERVRLRGFGLSIDFKNDIAATVLRATVHTPVQKDIAPDYRRPPFALGDVRGFNTTVPVAYYVGSAIHNVDPRGEWMIVLEEPGFEYEKEIDIGDKKLFGVKTPIEDLKLHLRITSRPRPGVLSLFSPEDSIK